MTDTADYRRIDSEIRSVCPCCGWAVVIERDTPDGTCPWCAEGKCTKAWVTPAGIDARAAAKDLIRYYVLRGDDYDSTRISGMGRHSWPCYEASVVSSGSIRVTRVHGQPTNARFGLRELWNEILAEREGVQIDLFGVAS